MMKKLNYVLICMLVFALLTPTVTCLGTVWTEKQKLLAADGASGDIFGHFASLSGNTAVIGAHCDDDHGLDSGSAYVFINTGTSWSQQAKLLAVDGAINDYFGWSGAVDGDTAIIGAIGDDDNGADAGAAYVYVRSGASWTQQQKLLAGDGASGDNFGYSVSLSGDTVIIGAPFDDDVGGYTGSAYVFTRSGASWTQQAKILPTGVAAGDYLGDSVFIAGDTALMGAPFDNDNGVGSGSVYVFTRTGTSWVQQAKLLASDGQEWDNFGTSLSFSNETALIGADGDNDNNYDSGSTYVFVRTGTTWNQQAKLLADDGEMYDFFGGSCSLSGDIALIGAAFEDDGGDSAGSAYVYERVGTTWTQQQKLLASDGSSDDWFGGSVCIEGVTAFITAYGNDDYGTESGSAYVFAGEIFNQPPVANFTWTPHYPYVNQSVLFDASASSDPDGTIVLYEWDWDNDGVYEENHTTQTATHSWGTSGEYPLTLRVTDDGDASTTLTCIITVFQNHPPNIPIIEGPLTGNVGTPTSYNFTSTDPDGDSLYWMIDWGDSSGTEWIGPYPCGTITQSHTWTKKGTYIIKAKVKDPTGWETGWGALSVKMPYSSTIPCLFFLERFFERFPTAFPVLRQILGY
jgi:hypothetical protein